MIDIWLIEKRKIKHVIDMAWQCNVVCGPTKSNAKKSCQLDFHRFRRRDEHQFSSLDFRFIFILYRFAIASAAIDKFSQLPICTRRTQHTHIGWRRRTSLFLVKVCAFLLSVCVATYNVHVRLPVVVDGRWQVGWVGYWRVSSVCVCVPNWAVWYGFAQSQFAMCTRWRIGHKFTWHVTHFRNISLGEQHPGIGHFVWCWRQRWRRHNATAEKQRSTSEGKNWPQRKTSSVCTTYNEWNTEIDQETHLRLVAEN